MSPFLARTWLILALTLAYLVAVHLAFLRASPRVAATAVALLLLLVLASIRGPRRMAWRLLLAVPGIAIVVLTARGAAPLPLLLPPVAIPALIAFGFGRTLLPGRTALIERFARGFHAPEIPSPRILSYARGVTWAWAICANSPSLNTNQATPASSATAVAISRPVMRAAPSPTMPTTVRSGRASFAPMTAGMQ